MNQSQAAAFLSAWNLRYTAHPWHGISIGEEAPYRVTAFIEVIPTDMVKYEVDKASGYLKIDRPQKFSNILPALYGFIPQTYCKAQVGEYCARATGRAGIVGDDDPLDICVLTERVVSHGHILVQAMPIGGLRLIDGGQADDKIIAVLAQDEVYGHWRDIADMPAAIINRLRHYFLTYKQLPGEPPKAEITHVYGREEALEVIRYSQADYWQAFGQAQEKATSALVNLLAGLAKG